MDYNFKTPMKNIEVVNIQTKLDTFSEHWSPKIIGELNEQLVKIAKVQGEFVMHKHEHEDELFLVISGKLFIELQDKTLEINPGEFVIIPKGIDHRPYAPEETSIMLFEPKSTLNTGNVESELTVRKLDNI